MANIDTKRVEEVRLEIAKLEEEFQVVIVQLRKLRELKMTLESNGMIGLCYKRPFMLSNSFVYFCITGVSRDLFMGHQFVVNEHGESSIALTHKTKDEIAKNFTQIPYTEYEEGLDKFIVHLTRHKHECANRNTASSGSQEIDPQGGSSPGQAPTTS